MIYIAKEIQASTADKAGSPSSTTVAQTGKECIIQGSNSWLYRTFLKYDLSGISSSAVILSAKMRVYDYFHNDNGGSGTTNISRITTDWDDNSVSWNNQPSWEGSYLSADVSPPGVGNWSDWDITSLVQKWVDGTYPNYGVYIKNNNEGSYRYDWHIRNHYFSEELASYLEIEYTDYAKKYLIRSESTIYTIVAGALSALESTDVIAELFRTDGFDELPASELLTALVDPEILYWVDTTDDAIGSILAVQTAVPLPQTLESDDYFMNDSTVLGIEKAIAVATDNVQFAVSFDSGVSWKTFIDGAWAELSEDASGMSATTLNSIPTESWNAVATTGKFRFRISLMDETSEFTSLVVDYLNEAETTAESDEGDE